MWLLVLVLHAGVQSIDQAMVCEPGGYARLDHTLHLAQHLQIQCYGCFWGHSSFCQSQLMMTSSFYLSKGQEIQPFPLLSPHSQDQASVSFLRSRACWA